MQPFCPRGGVKVSVFTNEIPGSRLTGGIFPGEFTFGAPMKDGASWRLKVIETTPAGLYTCLPEEASGNVGGNERATNIAGATEVVSISCSLTKLGWQEVERLRSEKKASDELLLDQGREAVKDILAKAKADAAVAPTAPLDSGLSAQTDAAINAGRAAADGAIAGGNMQVIEAMQSIAQRSMEQHALERQPISAASAASDAALGGRTESSSTSSSPSAYSGQSYSTNVDFHAHNPANEAAACIIAVDKYGYAANDIRDNNSGGGRARGNRAPP